LKTHGGRAKKGDGMVAKNAKQRTALVTGGNRIRMLGPGMQRRG